MEYILDSVRRIISHWVATQTPIAQNVSPGDTTLTVESTVRFRSGDEVILRNPFQGETPIYIDEVIDNTHLSIVDPIRFEWSVSEDAVIEKTFYGNMLQGIYLGDPTVIPRYPAVTVNAEGRSSEWFTLDSTKEEYTVTITVYTMDSNQEDAYRFLLHIVDSIQKGLKKNIFPLVAPYNTTILSQDIAVDDQYIKVADTSLFQKNDHIILEDKWKVVENIVTDVIDDNTLKLYNPICFIFTTDHNTQIIKNTRFIWNSWPKNIKFGKIFRGTMLKAATIDWFAWEEEIEPNYPREPAIF
ncbi:MAG: hypothetical protein ACOC5T_03075 [Elusimicrobiota bacterium]